MNTDADINVLTVAHEVANAALSSLVDPLNMSETERHGLNSFLAREVLKFYGRQLASGESVAEAKALTARFSATVAERLRNYGKRPQ